MPNWCFNYLCISHPDKKEMDKLAEYIKKHEEFFAYLKPDGDWGTKWDADNVYIDDLDESMTLSFNTAWSPPEQWFAALCKKYPDKEFKLEYDEPGMCFRGYFESDCEGGYINHDHSWQYDGNTYDECPKCKEDSMYTGNFDIDDPDKAVYKCSDCGYEETKTKEEE